MKIILLWKPISTQHAYLQHWKMRFMRKEAKSLKESYVQQAKEQYKWNVLSDELSIKIELYFPDRRVRDWDNYHKLSMDALTWIVWEDDSQIKQANISVMLIDKENPRIEITID